MSARDADSASTASNGSALYMSDDFESAWELSSGLPLDGARAVVTAAEFGYRQNIIKEALLLCLTFTPTEGEETEQVFSIGKGWEATGKGAAIVRANGRRGNINDQTNYGKFIATALKVAGLRDALIARKGDPLQAATWLGMDVTLGITRETTTNPETKQEKETSRLVIVEFHGANGDAEKPATKAGKVAPSAVISDELEAKLLELASANTEHDDFMAAAYETVEGVAGNPSVEALVMSTGKGSIWARAKAS